MDEIVIKVDSVYKDFLLPQEKINSVKGIVTGITKGSPWRLKETQHALKDISFEIKKGEFFGIVGRNGSGKSTLLKILANIYQPTKGKVYTRGKLVPFIELGVGFNPELTGRENVYLNGAMLGFSDKQIDKMYDDIVDFAELKKFMDQKLKNYSSGMQVRLAFSMATRSEADILLIDEVLAVGDADFQRKCFEYFRQLKHDKHTVVFVSHDMSAVRQFCDQAVLIENSKIIDSGPAEKIATQYTKMFIDEANEREQDGVFVSEEDKRMGNGDVKFTNVTTEVNKDNVLINITAKVHKDVKKLVYGLHILAQDGTEIMATNNRLIQKPDILNLKAGNELSLTWEVLNIFNDGKYSVSVTMVDDVSNTLDWIDEARTFRINRAERSTTSVLPPINIRHSIK